MKRNLQRKSVWKGRQSICTRSCISIPHTPPSQKSLYQPYLYTSKKNSFHRRYVTEKAQIMSEIKLVFMKTGRPKKKSPIKKTKKQILKNVENDFWYDLPFRNPFLHNSQSRCPLCHCLTKNSWNRIFRVSASHCKKSCFSTRKYFPYWVTKNILKIPCMKPLPGWCV